MSYVHNNATGVMLLYVLLDCVPVSAAGIYGVFEKFPFAALHEHEAKDLNWSKLLLFISFVLLTTKLF